MYLRRLSMVDCSRLEYPEGRAPPSLPIRYPSVKRPAFQFYPPEWKGTRWVQLDPLTSALPSLPACYVVYLDGRLTYVGQTTNLRARLRRGHLINYARYSALIDTPWGFCATVTVKARFADRYGDWAMRELRLIHRLQPSGNCVGSTRARRAARG